MGSSIMLLQVIVPRIVVIAVLGSQSTGKSLHVEYCLTRGTLLNRLFGTSFDVMDEQVRRQTTQGIL